MEYIRNKRDQCIEIKISWHIDDVLWRAKDQGVKITRKEASQVLELMLRKHDANMGISWETIDFWIDEVKGGL